MRKKMVALVLAATMTVMSLAGCGSSTSSSSSSSSSSSASTEAAAEETAEATTTTDENGIVYTEKPEIQSGAKKITVSIPDPEGSYIGVAATEFANRAMTYSNGTLDISISGNGSLYGGDTAAGIKMLSAGSLQMLILASSVYASFIPGMNVISVPYMFDDQAQLLDYLNSETGDDLFGRTEDMSITTVGRWTRSFREVTNSKRAVTSPEDLKGMVLRVPNNSLYVEFFSACGAVTTPMNFSEVYNALQLNTLDGQENPVDVPYSNKFYEVQKYISFTNHMADAWVVGINSSFLSGLTEEQQAAIKQAAEEVQQWNVDYMAAQDQVALKTLTDNGMESNEISDEAKQQFIEISQSCYDTFKELIADDDLFNATTAFTGRDQ